MGIDRRSLLLTGTLGLGAFAATGIARAATVAGLRGFTHAVASGEPAADGALVWTRYVPAAGGEAEVAVEVATTPDFARPRTAGAQITGPWRDHTVKLQLTGLEPGRDYHYRFAAPDGSRSPAGRFRTLPGDGRQPWRAAVFSCSNLGFGWFNAYGHAARREDLDCVIHLGDYFYEYDRGHYPEKPLPGRVIEPADEVVHLADYRLRYASYRADPDLQALHRRYAMIAQWDDHESANDSWEGGAENHDPAAEGDWNARRAAAVQAYREWMPISDEPWRAYDVGSLATLFRTETRLFARTRQHTLAQVVAGGDPAALARFRDGAWIDPAATMMGTAQERWLAEAMRKSAASGRRWQVVGFGTVMGETVMPAAAAGWAGGAKARAYVAAGEQARAAGLPFNFDNWGGYPAARARFLRAAQASGGDPLVISGDSHNAWAYDLAQDGRPVAVEFAGTSVTSPGLESEVTTDPRTVAADLVRANPELRWCDTSRRGYMALTLTADQAVNEWVMVGDIGRRSPAAAVAHRAIVRPGRHVLA